MTTNCPATPARESSSAPSPWTTHAVRIDHIQRECEGVATYRLRFCHDEAPERYQFLPGQFNMLYLPGVGESAISMSGDSFDRTGWIHTVRVAGNVTKTLARLNVGNTLGLRGPFGIGWPIEPLIGRDVVIVAGGLGLAPLRPLIYHILRNRGQFRKVWLIVGARSPAVLLYPGEYANWQQQGIDVSVTVDRPSATWTGKIGVVTVLLDRLPLPDPGRTHLVACGPEVMMKYVARSGLHREISPSAIWLSMERNMQCAVGLCGHCQLGPSFICKDGPVLTYERLQPYLAVEAL